jgi:hypothetical protein
VLAGSSNAISWTLIGPGSIGGANGANTSYTLLQVSSMDAVTGGSAASAALINFGYSAFSNLHHAIGSRLENVGSRSRS